jgi:tetraprenyl-beta-curcumene synthase
VRYWIGVLPLARRELRSWRRRASEISNPRLRAHALSTLGEEVMNVEAAAVFATLVPSIRWPALIRLLVAVQVMYDYLDTVSEVPAREPLRNGLQLHRALVAAVDPSEPIGDFYRHHPDGDDDGGYLESLVATCRGAAKSLPSSATVMPLVRRAAVRCGEGQSHVHAAMHEGDRRLAGWSRRQDRAAGYDWWELAAGAISSVGVYALLAAAAARGTTAREAARIDAAYFPAACALSALLDSLIDRDRDVRTANPSSIGHYATIATAAERLAEIAARADVSLRALRHGRRHAAILAGIAGYYLSADGATRDGAGPIADAIVDRFGASLPLILATVRLRRRLGGHDPSPRTPR